MSSARAQESADGRKRALVLLINSWERRVPGARGKQKSWLCCDVAKRRSVLIKQIVPRDRNRLVGRWMDAIYVTALRRCWAENTATGLPCKDHTTH